MNHVQIVACLLLLFSLFSISMIHATFGGNETDRLALLAFKHSISLDPQMAMSSWNDSIHFCQWEGVTCDRRHPQRVIILDIFSRGLVGPLSPYVGNLSFLRVLRIFNNSFYGEIPATISGCSKLAVLNVGENNLVGKLPQELSALSKLMVLIVEMNSFIGGIQSFLGNLTSLKIIGAAYNLLEGSIPDSIGRVKNLSVLQLATNNFSGMIPPSLYNLSLLTVFSVDQNHFQGRLPPNIGSMFRLLRILQLSDNQFTGTLPVSLSKCSHLEILQVNTNNFHGKIVIDFGGLMNIWEISLYENNFGSGEIDEMNFIESATNCSKLKAIDISHNKFSGSLPNSIGNLSSQLFYLNFGGNYLYGKLPSTIGNLVNLASFSLQNNHFTGTIPYSIGNLQKIQRLVLRKNKFFGTIPDCIGNLSLLNELWMGKNRLEGIIPKSLGNCQQLLQLELSENNLSGPIPKELFRLSSLSLALNLSHNHILGTLPLEVGNLKNLGALDVSANNLSGEIPNSLGNCISLINLFLQKNSFQGSMPSSLSSLKGIENLDLSHNNLSGQIPRFLEHFSMEHLNLSFNNFEGELPIRGIFANQRVISVVGNNKLCGGIPQLHLCSCSTQGRKKQKGRSLVLIIVIVITCTLLFVVIVLCFLYSRQNRLKTLKSSGPLLEKPVLRLSYERLLEATNGFSSENLIGKGSFGFVYKGILDVDDVVVSVKVLNHQCRESFKSFMTECEALRNVRHRNLIKIITACSSVDFHGNDFKALVYEFMPNGSLEGWLHTSQETINHLGELHKLDFLQRINIAIDVACALDYLHHQCENCIIHCDLKPSNILLDQDMVAHVGDFGLAKILVPALTDAIQSSSIGLRGTIGYVAPEYGLGSEISTNGDVYSFGILILEMIIGKRPTDKMFKEDLNLHNFASMAVPKHVKNIVDPSILEDDVEAMERAEKNKGSATGSSITEECLISIIKIGVACSVESPQARMSIKNALHELTLVRNIILQTSKKI